MKVPEDDGAIAAARDNQILSDEAIGRIIAAARIVDEARGHDGDLLRLFIVMTSTGARFSQVVRLRVRDLQVERSRLTVPPSRNGVFPSAIGVSAK
jgi:integrase